MADDATRPPQRQPKGAVGAKHRPVRAALRIGKIEKHLGAAQGPAHRVKRHPHHLARGGVGETGALPIGVKADRVGDGDLVEKLAQRPVVIAIDRARPSLGALAHGADPKPAPRVGAPVIGPCRGVVAFQRADDRAFARRAAKQPQGGFRGDQQARVIDPARGADMFVELPCAGVAIATPV